MGGVVAAGFGVTSPASFAVANPAASFGTAFVSGAYGGQWLSWIGSLSGAFVAAVLCKLLLSAPSAAAHPDRPEVIAATKIADPKSAEENYRKGVALYHNGMLEEAAEQFALATEGRPTWPEPYYYIGIVYRDFGDEENASAFFEAALHFRAERREDLRINRLEA